MLLKFEDWVILFILGIFFALIVKKNIHVLFGFGNNTQNQSVNKSEKNHSTITLGQTTHLKSYDLTFF